MIENENIKLTVILACFGKALETEEMLMKTIESLSIVKDNIMLIVVTEGIYLSDSSLIQNLKTQFKYIEFIRFEEERNVPAKLLNIAFKHVSTPYLSFLWAGCYLENRIQEFAKNPMEDSYVYAINSQTQYKIPMPINQSLIYGWSQCTRLFALSNLIISKEAWKMIGEFDESNLLQKDFDWEWILRLARYFTFTIIGTEVKNNIINLKEYPFKESFDFNNDIVHRYVLRNRKVPYTQNKNTEKSFYKDLRGYKITIIGGYWEYHHSQLAFLNYLDKLYGKGFATYKMLLDDISAPHDVEGSDLVIIVRSRNTNILEIINKCKKDNIGTLYMIDDNWLSIAEDLKEVYGQLFVKGNPQYDTFIEAIKICDFVITYNKFLCDDISIYNKNTILFPLNINLDFYMDSKTKFRKNNPNDKMLIGYAGSLRHDDVAFAALSNVARKYDNVRVLLFGGLSERQRSLFEGIDIITIEHMPYQIYCKTIKDLTPDVLLAPLINNRSAMSKCPNKYLEIGAIKAAGIYTDMYPYNEVVKDGIDGLLVPDNTVSAWEEKITLLINNKNLLSKIKNQCHSNVKKRYSTEKVIKKFCKMIDKVIKQRERVKEE
ncbi:MAG TPA: hypothetical protein DEP72_08495 [Clostridiales bacterium]|nr:MAG: hypothetical protein A2Y18_07320 [Clostridiales bacterium GWD2_32_19]HCC08176.1 hypothetical protein [Clostridiales bacterium]